MYGTISIGDRPYEIAVSADGEAFVVEIDGTTVPGKHIGPLDALQAGIEGVAAMTDSSPWDLKVRLILEWADRIMIDYGTIHALAEELRSFG